MTLRCRPGDLAVIIGRAAEMKASDGRVVEVVHRTPEGRVLMPAGYWSLSSADCWLIHLQSPTPIMLRDGSWRMTIYAVCPDNRLRPIRDPGDDAVDEMLRPLPSPVDEEAIHAA